MYINAVLQQTGPSNPARPRLEGERDVVNALLNGSEYIPQQEDNIRHTNKADIVRTANLYLVHPVIQALWAHPKYNGTLVSQSEDFQHGTRTDITFMKVGLNQVHRTFFILEYKRRGMIHGSDFHIQGGVIPVPPSLQQILPQNVNAQQFARAILYPVNPGQKPTQAQKTAVQSIPAPYITPGPSGNNLASTFEENPMRLITQAAAYTVHHSTRYVALFNYDNLICCYFPWLDPTISPEDNEDLNKNLAGEYPVEIEIYPSNSVEQRLALLGIMWTALENTPWADIIGRVVCSIAMKERVPSWL